MTRKYIKHQYWCPPKILFNVLEQQNLANCDYLQGQQSENSESAWGCYSKIIAKNNPAIETCILEPSNGIVSCSSSVVLALTTTINLWEEESGSSFWLVNYTNTED